MGSGRGIFFFFGITSARNIMSCNVPSNNTRKILPSLCLCNGYHMSKNTIPCVCTSATPTTRLLTNWRECGLCGKTLARIKKS